MKVLRASSKKSARTGVGVRDISSAAHPIRVTRAFIANPKLVDQLS